VKSKKFLLPGVLADSICSFRDPLYEQVRLQGGTPSALAFKRFGVYNLHLEPWCHEPRWQALGNRSVYWIQVEKLDDLANPDPNQYVLGRVGGIWSRWWDHSWADNCDNGNERDHAAFLERCAQIRTGLRHSASISNRM
jgi:hypothetical protein